MLLVRKFVKYCSSICKVQNNIILCIYYSPTFIHLSHHLQLGPQILKFDLPVGVPHSWVELKCGKLMEPGGQSVMICLGLLMLAYSAELWDLIELCVFHTILDLALELVTITAPLSLYDFHPIHPSTSKFILFSLHRSYLAGQPQLPCLC